jgi:VanZ family protein
MSYSRAFRFLPALAYMGLIFYLSSLSFLPSPVSFVAIDKVEHMGEYGILDGFLLAGGLNPLAAAVVTSLYGASDEFHQSFVPNRDCSVWDWVADSMGAALVSLMWIAWKKRRS